MVLHIMHFGLLVTGRSSIQPTVVIRGDVLRITSAVFFIIVVVVTDSRHRGRGPSLPARRLPVLLSSSLASETTATLSLQWFTVLHCLPASPRRPCARKRRRRRGNFCLICLHSLLSSADCQYVSCCIAFLQFISMLGGLAGVLTSAG